MVKKAKFMPVCGMSEVGVDAFLDQAEETDRGTTRHPWPKTLKSAIKAEISGMSYLPGVKATVNRMVLEKAGPGLFGKGPFPDER